MSLTNITLLDSIVYGTPSGNYDGSSLDFTSDPAEAAGYYRGVGNVQTLLISVADFVGRIRVQATLSEDPLAAAWFELEEFGDGSSILTTQHSINQIGNFSWMRVEVLDFAAGTINFVRLSY